jgi:4-amino-4-deoxy-L-arabinose transferase-like glycosyltransferase
MNLTALFTRLHPRYHPFIASLFSVVVLLTFWTVVPGGAFNQGENGDYVNYYLPLAQNMVNGQDATLHGKIALNYPIGYPLIVAANLYCAKLTGINEELIMRLSVIVFFACAALLIYLIALKIWTPPGALLASALWSCYPIVLWAARNPNTELPFSAALYASLLCLLTGWQAKKRTLLFFFMGGVFIGIAMLIRPIAIGLGLLFVCLVLFGQKYPLRKRVVLAVCLLTGNLLTVLPWELWVYSKTNAVILL